MANDGEKRETVSAPGAIVNESWEFTEVSYTIGDRLGRGSFGDVHDAKIAPNFSKTIPREEWMAVAAKIERHGGNKSEKDSSILKEYNTYKIIAHKGRSISLTGFARCFGIDKRASRRIMFLDLLGKSLEERFKQCAHKFSVKTILQLAQQCIGRVWTLHQCGIIFRDVKPENFLLGREGTPDAHIVHLVDFGLAKQYRTNGKAHIPFTTRKGVTGTARYCSINAHQGYEQSRRDDMTAIVFMLIYFNQGSLPWQGLAKHKKLCEKPTSRSQLLDLIGTKKEEMVDALCNDENILMPLRQILQHTLKLQFEDEPDYKLYLNYLDIEARQLGIQLDTKFDWDNDDTVSVSGGSESLRDWSLVTNMKGFYGAASRTRSRSLPTHLPISPPPSPRSGSPLRFTSSAPSASPVSADSSTSTIVRSPPV